MKVIKVRVEEFVKETEKAVNVKFSVYKNHKGYEWSFWIPKSVVTFMTQYDEQLEMNETYALIQPWFFNKMADEFGGHISGVNNNKPIEIAA